jgi:hypothetical protein
LAGADADRPRGATSISWSRRPVVDGCGDDLLGESLELLVALGPQQKGVEAVAHHQLGELVGPLLDRSLQRAPERPSVIAPLTFRMRRIAEGSGPAAAAASSRRRVISPSAARSTQQCLRAMVSCEIRIVGSSG